MVSKISTKKIASEIDQILNNTIIGGKRKTKKNLSNKKTSKKKKLSRTGFKTNQDDELNAYVKGLVNLRRSVKSKKSKKSKRALPEKLIQFRKLTDEAGNIIGKKGPIAMKVAKAVKDDLAKKMDASTIDNDYSGFIKKAIQLLKDNSDHYIKISKSFEK